MRASRFSRSRSEHIIATEDIPVYLYAPPVSESESVVPSTAWSVARFLSVVPSENRIRFRSLATPSPSSSSSSSSIDNNNSNKVNTNGIEERKQPPLPPFQAPYHMFKQFDDEVKLDADEEDEDDGQYNPYEKQRKHVRKPHAKASWEQFRRYKWCLQDVNNLTYFGKPEGRVIQDYVSLIFDESLATSYTATATNLQQSQPPKKAAFVIPVDNNGWFSFEKFVATRSLTADEANDLRVRCQHLQLNRMRKFGDKKITEGIEQNVRTAIFNKNDPMQLGTIENPQMTEQERYDAFIAYRGSGSYERAREQHEFSTEQLEAKYQKAQLEHKKKDIIIKSHTLELGGGGGQDAMDLDDDEMMIDGVSSRGGFSRFRRRGQVVDSVNIATENGFDDEGASDFSDNDEGEASAQIMGGAGAGAVAAQNEEDFYENWWLEIDDHKIDEDDEDSELGGLFNNSNNNASSSTNERNSNSSSSGNGGGLGVSDHNNGGYGSSDGLQKKKKKKHRSLAESRRSPKQSKISRNKRKRGTAVSSPVGKTTNTFTTSIQKTTSIDGTPGRYHHANASNGGGIPHPATGGSTSLSSSNMSSTRSHSSSPLPSDTDSDLSDIEKSGGSSGHPKRRRIEKVKAGLTKEYAIYLLKKNGGRMTTREFFDKFKKHGLVKKKSDKVKFKQLVKEVCQLDVHKLLMLKQEYYQ